MTEARHDGLARSNQDAMPDDSSWPVKWLKPSKARRAASPAPAGRWLGAIGTMTRGAGGALLALLMMVATADAQVAPDAIEPDARRPGATEPGAARPDRARSSMIPVQAPQAAEPTDGRVRLLLPAVVLAAPASEATLPIELSARDNIPRGAFLRLRGLPAMVGVQGGHAVAPGTWAIPMAAVEGLKLTIPAGSGGKNEFWASLVTIDGTVIAEAKSALVVAAAGLIAPRAERQSPASSTPSPAAPTDPAPNPSAGPVAGPVTGAAAVAPVPATAPPPAASLPPRVPDVAPTAPVQRPSAPPAMTPEARKRAEAFMARGTQQLREGNIAAARLFFERAAEEGHAEAALELGGTYDTRELARLRTQGIKADALMARRWYERARDLGSSAAADRLQTPP